MTLGKGKGHKHDRNGQRGPNEEQKIGHEHVVYRAVYCSCGEYQENEIVRRINLN